MKVNLPGSAAVAGVCALMLALAPAFGYQHDSDSNQSKGHGAHPSASHTHGAPAVPASKKSVSVKKAGLVCPVTGDKIASVKAAAGHSTYAGKTYYFCCADCKPRFDKNPAKFAKNAAHGKYEKM